MGGERRRLGLASVTALKATELLVGEWSPDDRRLVIDAAIAGNSDVYVVSLEGGPPVQLTTEAAFDGLAHWSADGRSIYFSSDKSGSVELWKMPADGGRAVQVTHEGGVQPAEAPDGRTLFYLDRAGETEAESSRCQWRAATKSSCSRTSASASGR